MLLWVETEVRIKNEDKLKPLAETILNSYNKDERHTLGRSGGWESYALVNYGYLCGDETNPYSYKMKPVYVYEVVYKM